jgi:hypothetical protein
LFWQGEDDMAILQVGEFRDACLNPVINGDFAARRTKTGFAGMRDFFAGATFRADIVMKTQRVSFTGENSSHIVMDSGADKSSVLRFKLVPIVVMLEDVLD